MVSIPCMHVYCEQCLVKWAQKDKEGSCPQCRKKVSYQDKCGVLTQAITMVYGFLETVEKNPKRALTELERLQKENIEIKIELTETKNQLSGEWIWVEEMRKENKKLWKDANNKQEWCLNCKVLNGWIHEQEQKLQIFDKLEKKFTEQTLSIEWTNMQAQINEGLVRALRTELQSKKELEYLSMPEPDRINLINHVAEDLKILDFVSQIVFNKLEKEPFPTCAFWKEDGVKRIFVNEAVEFCDGTVYVGETDETG